MRVVLGEGIPGLADAQRQLAEFLENAGCDPRTLFRVELVVEEVVMNVLSHGQAVRTGLEVSLADGGVMIAVEDDGPAFDPLQVESAPLATRLEDAAIGGQGLRLIRKNALSLCYERTPAGRNRLEVRIL